MEVSDGLISVDLDIAQVRAYAMRPDNSNLAVACRKALEQFVDEDFVQQLRDHTCMAGLPHTGDSPKEDHGHADCFFLNKAADEIERLRAEVKSLKLNNKNLHMEIKEKKLEISHLKDQLKTSRSIVKSMITRLRNIGDNRTSCEIVIK